MNRKIVSAIMGLCLLLSACGGSKTAGTTARTTRAAETTTAVSQAAETTAAKTTTAVSQAAEQAKEIRFTDDLGREVVLKARPKRTAVLIGSFASVWQLAGGNIVAAANDAWTLFDLNLDKSVVNLGSLMSINQELLAAAEPDFIIASTNTKADIDLMPTFERMGIPAAYFNVNNFDQYLHMLRICTEVTGREDLYRENGLEVKARVDKVIEEAKKMEHKPRVLCLRASGVSIKAKGSKGTVLGEMLKNLGCVNIADQDGSILENLSLEKIVAEDPEFIFVVQQGSNQAKIDKRLKTELTGQPAWAGLTAVKEGRLFFLDQRLYNVKPNNRWGEAYEKLYEILKGHAQS